MQESCGLRQLLQRLERVLVETVDALRLLRDDQRLLPEGILGRHARRASAGVAGLGLEAAQRKHEPARRIAPVRAERHGPRDVEGADDLAAGADLDALSQVEAHQRVVHELQAFLQRGPDVVREFERCGAGAAFLAVDDDEVGRQAGLEHRLADRKPLPGMADAQLEARRLAA